MTIADAVGVSEHSVISSIERLRRGGDLYVIPGKPGRGHPNQYWMVLKPAEKTSTATQVFEDGKPALAPARKPASEAKKTCTAMQENHCKNHEDSFEGVPKGTPSQRMEREFALTRESDSPPAGGDPPLSRDAAGDSVPRGIASGGKKEQDQGFRKLRALWQRGWASDDTPKAIAIARAAFAKACTIAEPDAILEAARTHVANADAPRFLASLPQWLAAKGWEKTPPQKSSRDRGKVSKRRNARGGNSYAKPDMFKIALEAGGYREDADGNMFWPSADDGGCGDDDAPLATSMWGGGQ
jgi:hypothetical protein